ncbi:hypothetical protein ENBRE01_0734 [Enteropsectra breve]|nr:hypothetical protein ENBRE01_0734 [Enteropsectra breve]
MAVIAVNNGQLYYTVNLTSLHTPYGVITTQHKITGVKFVDKHILIFHCHGFEIYEFSEILTPLCSVKCNIFILDAYFHSMKQVLLLGFDGRLHMCNSGVVSVLPFAFNKSIFSGKFTQQGIIIGSFEKMYSVKIDYTVLDKSNGVEALNRYFGSLSWSEVEGISHLGRIFDVLAVEEDGAYYTCADDRAIKSSQGLLIQEARNYFIKIVKVNEKLCAINRDGFLRIYKNGKLLFQRFFGPFDCAGLCRSDNKIYFRLLSDEIYEIDFENGAELSLKKVWPSNDHGTEKIRCSELKERDIVKRYRNGVCAKICSEGLHLLPQNITVSSVTSLPIDIAINKEALYLLYSDSLKVFDYSKNENCCDSKIMSNCYKKIHVIENKIYLHSDINLLILDQDLQEILSDRIPGISAVSKDYYGNKKGNIYSKDCFVKICPFKLVDVVEYHTWIEVLDERNNKYLVKKKDIENRKLEASSVQHIGLAKDLAVKRNASDMNENSRKLHLKNVQVYWKPSRCTVSNRSLFHSFTCQDKPKESKCQNIKHYLGTADGSVIIEGRDGLIDAIELDGSVVGIYTVGFESLVSCASGRVYVLSLVENKLYIKKEVKYSHRAISQFEQKISFSDGTIIHYTMGLKELNRECTSDYNNCLFKEYILYDGYIRDQSNKTKVSGCCINSVVEMGTSLYCAGEDHFVSKVSIVKGKLNKIGSIVAHCAQIHFICAHADSLYTLSSDGRICQLDENLKIKRYYRHYVKTPAFMDVQESKIIVYGENIQKIQR